MKTMTVRQLIDAISHLPDDMPVHVDEDDYPHVIGIKTSRDYDGPTEYAPPSGSVLLITDFPQALVVEEVDSKTHLSRNERLQAAADAGVDTWADYKGEK